MISAKSTPPGALDMSFRLKLIGSFAAVYVIWGSTYLAIRFAIETMPPFLMAGVRFLIAGSVLYVLARARGAEAPVRLHWKGAFIVGAFLLLGGNGGVVWAERTVPSGLTALLIATEPLWVVLLLWVAHERVRPTRGVVAGLLIGFAGVALLIGPSALSAEDSVDPIGALVVVVAALSWAQGSLLGRKLAAPKSGQLLAGMQMMAGGSLLVVAGIVTGEVGRFDPAAVSFLSFASLLYLIVFGAIVAFSAYSFLIRNVPPSRVATYGFVNPAVAVFLGWALAGEDLTPRTIVAAAIIVASVVLIITRIPSRGESESETGIGASSETEAAAGIGASSETEAAAGIGASSETEAAAGIGASSETMPSPGRGVPPSTRFDVDQSPRSTPPGGSDAAEQECLR